MAVSRLLRVLGAGLGENAAFYRSHPLLNFVYFAAVAGLTMFSNHPAYLLTSFVMAWVYSIVLRGTKAIKFNCLILLPTMVLTVLLNTLNVHNGVTVLFYLNDNRITLEAIVYGCAAALMLSSVMIWFSCFSVIVTEDKFIYMFGRIAPAIALTLSMILRYIPLLKNRFREVSAAQRCMGRGGKGRGLIPRIRQFGKEISILIAWSLEASIESADSMEARGYGLRGRTSFHLFKMSATEKCILAAMAAAITVCIYACIKGDTTIYYYPTILLSPMSPAGILCLGVFWLLTVSAVVIDIRGVGKWI